jgi:hypothetical protein
VFVEGIVVMPSHGLSNTYRCQEPSSFDVAGHVRCLPFAAI